jgi:hypothetical protein
MTAFLLVLGGALGLLTSGKFVLTVCKKALISIVTSPLFSPVLAHLVLAADYRIWGSLLL